MRWIWHLRRWLRSLVQEVPDSLAVCEFGCRETECCQGYWETCDRRRSYIATSRRWRSRLEGRSHTGAAEAEPEPSLAERSLSAGD